MVSSKFDSFLVEGPALVFWKASSERNRFNDVFRTRRPNPKFLLEDKEPEEKLCGAASRERFFPVHCTIFTLKEAGNFRQEFNFVAFVKAIFD